MAQQSKRRGRKNQMYSSCLEHAFKIWFRSANSHTGPQLHRCIRGRTDGSIRPSANALQKPLASGGASTDEQTRRTKGFVARTNAGSQTAHAGNRRARQQDGADRLGATCKAGKLQSSSR